MVHGDGPRPFASALADGTPTAATSGLVKVTRGMTRLAVLRRNPRIAFVAAMLACMPAVWVKGGCPVRSPAAQTRRLVVRRVWSTDTIPD